MIQVDTQSVGFSHTGGTFSPTVFYENTVGGNEQYPVCPSWITYDFIGAGQEGDDYVVSYRFTVAENTGGVRNDRITFQCTDTSGQTWTNYIYVTQGTGELTKCSIWKDTYFYASNRSSFSYSIVTSGVSVYFGTSYCRPGDGGCYVQVNKICQNYLKNVLPDIRELDDDVVENENAVRYFSLCGEDGYEVMNYEFLMDYGGDWQGESPYVMTEPINGHLDPRMKAMYTEYGDSQRDVGYFIYNSGDRYFNVTPLSLEFQASGGTANVSVDSLSGNWSVTSEDSFLSVTRNSGGFVVTCQNNSGSASRTGSIRVTSGNEVKVVTVSQYAHTLSVSPTSASFLVNGGDTTFNVTASTSYMATTQSAWLSITSLGNTGFTVNCLSNSTGNERTGTINVKLNGVDMSVNIDVTQFSQIPDEYSVTYYTNRGMEQGTVVTTGWGANYITTERITNGYKMIFDGPVTTVPDGAFANYSGEARLRRIILPSTITSIGLTVFANNQMTEITCYALVAPTITSTSFYMHSASVNGTLHIPAGADYSSWMGSEQFYLGYYNWTVVDDL